jgi:flagellar assembly protein FliH
MIKANLAGFTDNISKWETPQFSDRPPGAQQQPDPETLRAQAFEQGYHEGLETGTQQGLAETERKLGMLHSLLDALARPYEDINEEALAALAKLAGKIARCLVKRELRTEPETIMAMVRDTVSVLNTSAEKILVHLNPADALIIQNIARTGTEKSRWKLIDDPLIARGDCRVQSRDSLVDGSLQTRINTIIMQVQGDERG